MNRLTDDNIHQLGKKQLNQFIERTASDSRMRSCNEREYLTWVRCKVRDKGIRVSRVANESGVRALRCVKLVC